MTSRFQRALRPVLQHEGGFVNHPDDPGGATNRGITQRTYDAWRRSTGRDTQWVRHITDGEVEAIYRRQYWDVVRGDMLPPGVAYAVFDAAVNSGPARAARWLQRALVIEADGVIGEQTIDAAANAPPTVTIDRMCDDRMAFLRRLRHWPTFGRGWTRRVDEVRRQAKAWATDEAREPETVLEAPGSGRGPESRAAEAQDVIREPGFWVGTGGAGGLLAPLVASDSAPIQWAIAAVIVGAVAAVIIHLIRKRGRQ